MKKIIAALALTLMTTVALAQHHRPGPCRGPGPGHYRPGPGPGRGPWNPGPYRPFPIPRPMPHPGGFSCRVTMVDQYNRSIRTFYGRTDYNGLCRDALQNCNFEQRRMGGWGTRCVQY